MSTNIKLAVLIQEAYKLELNFLELLSFKGTVSRKSWRDECMGH
jgi:hypothetical protein